MSGRGSTIAEYAISKIGCPYGWGAEGPNEFDCSGLAKYCYGKVGISLPHHAASQADMGYDVDFPEEGDLIFFDYGKGVAHVGISIGGGQMVHASDSGVREDSFTSGYWGRVAHFAKGLV